MIILRVFILLLYFTGIITKEDCSTENNIVNNKYYGTYTSYENSFKDEKESDDTKEEFITMIYFIGRHGSRQENLAGLKYWKKYMPEIQRKLKNKRNNMLNLCETDYNNLIKWKLNIKENDNFKLLNTGKIEQRSIAKRLLSKFSTFFQTINNKQQLNLQSSDTKRTYDSAIEFLNVIFKHKNINFTVEKSLKTDNLIRCYKNYDPSYNNRSKSIKKNIDLFLRSDKFKNILSLQPSLLNLNISIEPNTIIAIWKLCAFEYLTFKSSPWCSLLNDNLVNTLEYLDDVKYYHLQGYGISSINSPGCLLIKDLWKFIELSNESINKQLL